jgi:hypothetical protein
MIGADKRMVFVILNEMINPYLFLRTDAGWLSSACLLSDFVPTASADVCLIVEYCDSN